MSDTKAVNNQRDRTERELRTCRELMNHANESARVMDAQLTGITETLTRVTQRAERLASADPTDPVRAGRAAQARENLTSIETILRGTDAPQA